MSLLSSSLPYLLHPHQAISSLPYPPPSSSIFRYFIFYCGEPIKVHTICPPSNLFYRELHPSSIMFIQPFFFNLVPPSPPFPIFVLLHPCPQTPIPTPLYYGDTFSPLRGQALAQVPPLTPRTVSLYP